MSVSKKKYFVSAITNFTSDLLIVAQKEEALFGKKKWLVERVEAKTRQTLCRGWFINDSNTQIEVRFAAQDSETTEICVASGNIVLKYTNEDGKAVKQNATRFNRSGVAQEQESWIELTVKTNKRRQLIVQYHPCKPPTKQSSPDLNHLQYVRSSLAVRLQLAASIDDDRQQLINTLRSKRRSGAISQGSFRKMIQSADNVPTRSSCELSFYQNQRIKYGQYEPPYLRLDRYQFESNFGKLDEQGTGGFVFSLDKLRVRTTESRDLQQLVVDELKALSPVAEIFVNTTIDPTDPARFPGGWEYATDFPVFDTDHEPEPAFPTAFVRRRKITLGCSTDGTVARTVCAFCEEHGLKADGNPFRSASHPHTPHHHHPPPPHSLAHILLLLFLAQGTIPWSHSQEQYVKDCSATKTAVVRADGSVTAGTDTLAIDPVSNADGSTTAALADGTKIAVSAWHCDDVSNADGSTSCHGTVTTTAADGTVVVTMMSGASTVVVTKQGNAAWERYCEANQRERKEEEEEEEREEAEREEAAKLEEEKNKKTLLEADASEAVRVIKEAEDRQARFSQMLEGGKITKSEYEKLLRGSLVFTEAQSVQGFLKKRGHLRKTW
jgi:hypothetical protein